MNETTRRRETASAEVLGLTEALARIRSAQARAGVGLDEVDP